MRQQWVIGNWKLNGDPQANQALCDALSSAALAPTCQLAVLPPSIFIPSVLSTVANSTYPIQVGAQAISRYAQGAYTGELSASMVKACGGTLTLVGHSERRQYFHDDEASLRAQFLQAKTAGLTPVLCVGETLAQREHNQTEAVIAAQLRAVLQAPEDLNATLVAYEPVWAIGTGKSATPAMAEAVHQFIRQSLAEMDANAAECVSILYGGSVKVDNAPQLMGMPNIDGALVGGASLKAADFLGIAACIKSS